MTSLQRKVAPALDSVLENTHLLKPPGKSSFLTHQSVVTLGFERAVDAFFHGLKQVKGAELVSVFSPQHGFYQTEQDNMKETPDGEIQLSSGAKLPVVSLYSEKRRPSRDNLDGIDTLFVDLPDIGNRIYTYLWSLFECLVACHGTGTKVIVLDRPNPLGLCYEQDGTFFNIEGNLLREDCTSFVGLHPIPYRHGLTLGELGHLFIQEKKLDVDYGVIPVQGLTRQHTAFQVLTTPFTMPSPNLSSFQGIMCFPLGVPLEAALFSEGRGTTMPFQLVGSPYFNPEAFMQKFRDNYYLLVDTPFPDGLKMKRHDFRPTFNKFAGEHCRGIQFHFQNFQNIHTFNLSTTLMYTLVSEHPSDFAWDSNPYEYNSKSDRINLIFGSSEWYDTLRQVQSGEGADGTLATFKRLQQDAQREVQAFASHNLEGVLLYS